MLTQKPKLRTPEDVISNGIEFDGTGISYYGPYGEQVCDLTADSKPVTGLVYETYPDGKIRYYCDYEDGFRSGEIVEYDEAGNLQAYKKQYNGLRREDTYDTQVNLRNRSYYLVGNLLSSTSWDAQGEQTERIPWKTGWVIISRGYMEEQIRDGNLTEAECVEMQKDFQYYLWQKSFLKTEEIQYVAGVDLAYWGTESEHAVCCIVVTDYQTGDVVERVHLQGDIHYPYIPGLLAFRELPLVLQTVKKLSHIPDVYMFDGNGVLHPRKMGLATMASIFLERPTLGVAKSYYKVGDTAYTMPEEGTGSMTDILIEGQVCGRVLRTQSGVKPVFVSVGNFMDLEQAVEIVNHMIPKDSHIPIPTREADLDTHRFRGSR